MENKTYSGLIKDLEPNQIFVFGSNTQGMHGGGAALCAMKFGAKYGQAYGLQGKTYAIVTKDLSKLNHPSITPKHIIYQIHLLYDFAKKHPDYEFLVAYSGTGVNLNGYSNKEMAEMFTTPESIPTNIIFEYDFNKLIIDELYIDEA